MPFRYIARAPAAWDRFRASPATIAATAGACGLLGGGLFVFLMVPATPSQTAIRPPVETTGTAVHAKFEPPPPTTEKTPTNSPKVEVTKTEPATPQPVSPVPAKSEPAADAAADDTAAADCDQQTWPYITPQCLSEREPGQRKVRVITTDRLAAPVVNAIETPVPAPKGPSAKIDAKVETKPDTKPVVAAPSAAAPGPHPAASSVAARIDAVAAPATATPSADNAFFKPEPLVPAAAASTEAKPQQASIPEPRRKSAHDKRKREAKRAAPRDDRAVKHAASVRDDEDDGEAVRDSRIRGRIVERWTEREYDVPSYDGPGRRRVIVMGRDNDRSGIPSARSYSRSVFQY